MKIKTLFILGYFTVCSITPIYSGCNFSAHENDSQKAEYDESPENNDSQKAEYDEDDDVFYLSRQTDVVEQDYQRPKFISLNDEDTSVFNIKGDVPYNAACIKGWKQKPEYQIYLPQLVKDCERHPWNAIGCLMVQNAEREIFGSGVQIEAGYVLTAAHNIFKRVKDESGENGERELFAEAITFYPMLDEETPKISLRGVTVAIFKDFYDYNTSIERRRDLDIALIKLETTGHKPFLSLPLSAEALDDKIEVMGYPGVSPYNARHLVSQNLNVYSDNNHHNEGKILYGGSNTTYAGQSGGAVCKKNNNDYQLVGIHTYAIRSQKTSGGVFLNKKNIIKINSWKNILSNL